MGKNRIGVVIRESVGGNKSSSRSADLHKLYQGYQLWCKHIGQLLAALKGHQQALLHIEKTRTGVSNYLSLHSCVVVVVVAGAK